MRLRRDQNDSGATGRHLIGASNISFHGAAVRTDKHVNQTWRPVADTVAFHSQSYFAVIHWENAERTAVSAFVKEMEKQLGR